MKAQLGLHGRIPAADRACEKCHREHRGAGRALIHWMPEELDHDRTGWALEGAHRDTDCKDCHDPRLIRDEVVRARLRQPKKRETWLGLGRRCEDCHFDEHRGQLEGRCQDCHEVRAFAPAPRFDHAKADFPLRGRHRGVECRECHPVEIGEASGFPAPRSGRYAR